jgi:hypothetical protein
MQLGWCLGWIIQLDHAVLIATVNFGPMGGGDVSAKRPDVPWANGKDVSHGESLHHRRRIMQAGDQSIRSQPLP